MPTKIKCFDVKTAVREPVLTSMLSNFTTMLSFDNIVVKFEGAKFDNIVVDVWRCFRAHHTRTHAHACAQFQQK